MDKKIITSKNMPASGPYSMAVEENGMIFISGQLPVNPSTGEIVTAIEPATRQVLTNLKTILEENG
ncbi:MAG: Rid family hydrolase, partial [Smithella sp.]